MYYVVEKATGRIHIQSKTAETACGEGFYTEKTNWGRGFDNIEAKDVDITKLCPVCLLKALDKLDDEIFSIKSEINED